MTSTEQALADLPRLWWCPAWGTLNAVQYHGNPGPDDPNCGKVAYVRDSDLAALTAADLLLVRREDVELLRDTGRWLAARGDDESLIVAQRIEAALLAQGAEPTEPGDIQNQQVATLTGRPNKYASPELIAAVEALPEYDPEKHGPLRRSEPTGEQQ